MNVAVALAHFVIPSGSFLVQCTIIVVVYLVERKVRFHDGSRKAAEFNEDAPVQEIFDFVAPAVPGASFQILGGFPPKPLTDKAMTLKDAGLCNAAVTVKLT